MYTYHCVSTPPRVLAAFFFGENHHFTSLALSLCWCDLVFPFFSRHAIDLCFFSLLCCDFFVYWLMAGYLVGRQSKGGTRVRVFKKKEAARDELFCAFARRADGS